MVWMPYDIKYPRECEDSPDGKHMFSIDLEHDSTGETINCEYCGLTTEQTKK